MRRFFCVLTVGLGMMSTAILPGSAHDIGPDGELILIPVAPQSEAFITVKSQAITELRDAASAGSGAAAFAVARALLVEFAPEADVDDGIQHLEQAAELGVVQAYLLLGDIFRSGQFGTDIDRNRAIEAYKAASDAGDTKGTTALASLILDTQLGAADRAGAINLLEMAANSGDIDASNTLGALYSGGRGVLADGKKALFYYNLGLVAGNRGSLAGAGDLLRRGTVGLDPAPDQALTYFKENARTGDGGARRRIADMTIRGEGVVADLEGGVQILEAMISEGDTLAMVALGDLYSRAEFLPADGNKANELYLAAAAQENPTGYLRLGDLYRDGIDGVSNAAKSVDYYEKAIALNNNAARRSLANLLFAGGFVPANPERGLSLLAEAAYSGDATAAQSLGVLYSADEPFQADYDIAKRFFTLSASLGNQNATLRMATSIANGPLASRHKAEALEILTNAVDGKIPSAASELAKLQMAGVFQTRGVSSVIEMLQTAVADSDFDATRYLLQLYRDGYGVALRPNYDAAEALLTSSEEILGIENAAAESVFLIAARGKTPKAFARIGESFGKLEKARGIQVLRQLRRANAGAYVFVIQQKLTELGLYSGRIAGILDSSTIRAFRAACDAAGEARTCAPGPLTDVTAIVIGNFIYS